MCVCQERVCGVGLYLEKTIRTQTHMSSRRNLMLILDFWPLEQKQISICCYKVLNACSGLSQQPEGTNNSRTQYYKR